MRIFFRIVSVCFILIFVFMSFGRLQDKFELTNYEYQSLIQVTRVLEMQPIYTKPSLDYIPMIYTPIYYYVSSIFVWIFGSTFFPLRLVSLLSTLGTGLVIYKYLKKSTGSGTAGLVGAGFFASCYVIGGMAYEVARVDSLALLFYAASIYSARYARGKKDGLVTGLLFALACLTKQTYLIFMFPVIFLFAKRNRSAMQYFILFTLALVAVFVAIMQYVSGGWFAYYTIILPAKHRFYENIIGRFFLVAYIYRYFLFTAAICMAVLWRKKKLLNFELFSSVFSILICVFYTLKIGGSNNMMFPAFVAVAILYAQTVFLFLNTGVKNKFINISNFTILIILLSLFIINGLSYLPYKNKSEAADERVRSLSGIIGEVFYPADPYSVYLAGKKKPSAHVDLINDLLGGSGDGEPTPEGLGVVEEIRHKLTGKQYRMLLFTEKDKLKPLYRLLKSDIERYYVQSETQISAGVTGYIAR